MGRHRTPYPVEFRAHMVELVKAGRTPEELAREFEPTEQTINNWVAQADRDAGVRHDGLTTAERQELTRLRRENRQLKTSRNNSSMCRQASGSSVMCARSLRAWVATTSLRRLHRVVPSNAVWPDPGCWHTCWSRSSQTICRFTDSRSCTREKVSSWIARCLRSGSVTRRRCCSRSLKHCVVM